MVSAAAGATGSIAGQIAKVTEPALSVSAGGPEKCRARGRGLRFRRVHRLPRERSGRRTRSSTVPAAWTSTSTTSAARSSTRCWAASRLRARVVLCGVISSYLDRRAPGTVELREPARRRPQRCRASTRSTNGDASTEAFAALRQWEQDGQLRHRADPPTRVSSRASRRSTDCSPGPTSARCSSRWVRRRVELSAKHIS